MSKEREPKVVQLRVEEAERRFAGRCYACLDGETMSKLGITIGDIVEIMGRKRTAAIAWPLRPEDQGREIIRIDGVIRKNAGLSLGEYARVRKADIATARSVTLAPTDFEIRADETLVDIIRRQLEGRPLVEGDLIFVTGILIGRPIAFRVVRTAPRGIVRLRPGTALNVLSKPAPEAVGVPRVTYEDIGGLHEEIQRVREMVELPLRHPELFQKLGIEPPKGVLLHGPPGCGKTLLAKAVANESDANFFSINGPEIMSKFYGESEARLREIFKKAQENAPGIIFIDEIDAIAPKRSEVTGEVEKRVVAQLLSLMDGLEARGNVIVIGATNMPEILDPALRRPGRFDREVTIGIPDKKGRLEILQIHTRHMPLAKDVDLKRLAEITHGFTGADLAALCREAAMKCLRRFIPKIDIEQERIPPEILDKMEVTTEDFLAAYREITPTALREVYVEIPSIRWEDIGGLEDVKQMLREVVEWPLKRPEVFKRMGIKPPKGILLYGPPGCGKTLLAKAVATESQANFISIKGPEIFSKWVGESEKAIREVFKKARMAAPAIIFFDEFDAIAPRRGLGYADTGVTERVISQLLTEVDGLIALDNVVVMAATNRPDILDPAVLRPGRFDRQIYVPSPDERARLQILEIYTKDMPLAKDVNLEELATKLKGYSGADIEALCREAALNALRRDIHAREVTPEDFNETMKVIGPSITPEMERWYEQIFERFKRIERERVITPIA